MPAMVRIPPSLQSLTGGQSTLHAEGGTVREVIGNVDRAHPGFGVGVCDESGGQRRFVNVYLNDDEIRSLDGLDTPVRADDEVWIVLPLAGG